VFTLVVPPESACGCGSGKQFGQCHLVNNSIVFVPHSVLPPRPQSGHAEKKCFLHAEFDCGAPMSGDHILSRTVLRVISERNSRLVVRGPGYERQVSVDSDSLKTKKWCRRHNSALSDIDMQAGRFVRAIVSAMTVLESGREEILQPLYLFSGLDIEKWLLKTLCSTYFAKATNITPLTHKLPSYVPKLFFNNNWPARLGLYFQTREFDGEQRAIVVKGEYSVMLHANTTHVTGVTVNLLGFSFTLAIADSLSDLETLSAHAVHRPLNLNLFEGRRVDPNAPIPTN
jgi:hypothetical protein